MSEYQGEKFKDYLHKKKIGVTKAAKMLGVSRATVYQYFDSQSLSREVVSKILTSFKIKEGELFPAEERKHEDMQSRLINALEDQILLLKNSLLDKDKIIEGLEARLKEAEEKYKLSNQDSGHTHQKAG